jgi:16S rRNA processing protein RimM
MRTAPTLLPLGPLVNTHGIRGELRLLPYNPDSTTLRPGLRVVLRRDDEQMSRQLTAVRRHKRFLLLTLDGCDSLAAAEALVGCELCVAVDDLPPLRADEVYHYELIGMAVVTTTGESLGSVAQVLTTGANDVCIVRDGAAEHLIPLVASVVREIDRAARRVVVEPLPGLLDA